MHGVVQNKFKLFSTSLIVENNLDLCGCFHGKSWLFLTFSKRNGVPGWQNQLINAPRMML